MDNKKIYVGLIFLILVTAGSVQGKPVETSASPGSATVDAGSTATYLITVKNNQGSADTVNLFFSGEMMGWASLSKTELSIPPGGSDSATLSITPPGKTMTGTYKLEVTALATSSEWDSTTVHATVSGVTAAHSISLTVGIKPSGSSADHIDPGDIRVNLYYTPLLVSEENDYVLKGGDQCCVGDVLRYIYTVGGDWYPDGGPYDTPPIGWVGNVYDIAESPHKFTGSTYKACICWWRAIQEKHRASRCTVDGTLACSYECKAASTGIQSTGKKDEYSVTEEGSISINNGCRIKCTYPIRGVYEPKAGEIYVTPSTLKLLSGGMAVSSPIDLMSDTEILSSSITLNAIKEERKPDLQSIVSTMNENTGGYVIRMNIRNTGDAKALVDEIILNLKSYTIVYKPDELDAGEESDLIIETGLESLSSLTEPIKADIYYRSEKLGCLTTREFTSTFELDVVGILMPHRSSQVYSMDVAGGCVNQYYSCYSPDKGGVLAAGYECFNRDPYFIPTKERFDLGFDLSSIPEGKDMASATINLNVGGVNRDQDLTVYSSDNDGWSPGSCEAEKDLCGPTYCKEECSRLFDLGVNPEVTVHVGSAGSYSFDVTEVIRSQYLGDKYASFQFRGSEENRWSSEGENSCTVPKNWDLYDVRVSSKPSLIVIYN